MPLSVLKHVRTVAVAATLVLVPLLTAVGGAVVTDLGLGGRLGHGALCPCSKGLFPMCSSTTGGYVASSQDCAENCGGVSDSVQCLFLRYFSWRRKCNCSLNLPERVGGVCDIDTGVVVSKDEDCARCRKMNASQFDSCDRLADMGVVPKLPPAIYEFSEDERQEEQAKEAADCAEKGKKPKFCGEEWDKLPACNMVTGNHVADSGCEAGAQGHPYTVPCKFLNNMTTNGFFFPEDCLFGDKAPNFVGRVAGFTGCQAVIHTCHMRWLRRDGALTHALCAESPACPAEAKEVVAMWPACDKLLRQGGGSCSVAKAQKAFDIAVHAICRPFGVEDFQ